MKGPAMEYSSVVTGKFISRPNRFIANVELDGAPVVCHVKNTGRCRELLVPGAAVVLSRAENPARRTAFDLIAVHKGGRLINIDSQSPNKLAAEYLLSLFPGSSLRSECVFGASRLDFRKVKQLFPQVRIQRRFLIRLYPALFAPGGRPALRERVHNVF